MSALLIAVVVTSCTSGTHAQATVALQVDVGPAPGNVTGATVVYVPPRGGKSRVVGHVASVATTSEGLTRLSLRVARSQRLSDRVAAYICTNHIKLQPTFRGGGDRPRRSASAVRR